MIQMLAVIIESKNSLIENLNHHDHKNDTDMI